ncbi:ATP-dependent protease La [Pseudozyma hubeiensis SY62]|uniref:ATP-dependent protease La n=1 Tax=Pseudozyma hubeiensis (strain SY62) TaxID=1305764 RepID=R9P0S3_PSEHS|nr:ATP-dependent protease La [Pseudozyma hubeiensis SY62]GAC94724.1 ATP-dependent protease La [Pseudozyma hubeiensis SY62]
MTSRLLVTVHSVLAMASEDDYRHPRCQNGENDLTRDDDDLDPLCVFTRRCLRIQRRTTDHDADRRDGRDHRQSYQWKDSSKPSMPRRIALEVNATRKNGKAGRPENDDCCRGEGCACAIERCIPDRAMTFFDPMNDEKRRDGQQQKRIQHAKR